MTNAVSSTETDAVVECAGGGRGAPLRHPSTAPAYSAGPLSGTVKLRLETSPPALSSSTVSHEPSVNLNSIRPRTAAGSVMAYPPPACALSVYPYAAGFQPLNEPAT